MTTSHHSDERGIALPLALGSIMVIGAIIAGTFFIARLELQSGDNSLRAVQALGASEAGIDRVLANWSTSSYNSMAAGSSLALGTVAMGGSLFHTDSLARLSNNLYLITSVGERRSLSGRTLARNSLGRYVRLDLPVMDINAAITTMGSINITGSSDISGVDSIPGGWGGVCPPAGPTQPGIRDSSNTVTTGGSCSGASCIVGSPQILIDPTVTSSTFTQFGNVTFTTLFNSANLSINGTYNGIGPVTTGSPAQCDMSVITNWGAPYAPSSACGDYFPIIAAAGGTRLTGGAGQGILLVNGDLDVSGGVEFYGPVVVLGTVTSTGTGGHFYGGLLAQNASFTSALLSGNSVVNYSACAVQRALRGSARATPLAERSWARLF